MSLHKTLVASAVFCLLGTAAFADVDLIDDLIVKVGVGGTSATSKSDETKTKSDLAYQVGLGYRFSEKGQLVVDYTTATINFKSDERVSTLSAELDYLFLDYSSIIRPFFGLGYGLTTVNANSSATGGGVLVSAGAFIEKSRFLGGVKLNYHATKVKFSDASFENPTSLLAFVGYRF